MPHGQMKISLITPAGKRSKSGNRTTAGRWARILRTLGHKVHVEEVYGGADADMMVALHAWRSADSMNVFRASFPGRPLVVALTGTDIYKFQHSHPEVTLDSMRQADWLVCLHDGVAQDIPAEFGRKLSVIPQSSPPLTRARAPTQRHFDICVIGHLREEKDSLRAAYAARNVSPESKLRVIHLGKAHDESWAREAEAEMARNERYIWRGEVPGWKVRREFVKTRLMVISSIMEGGANVVSEALVAGVPIIASDISGNIGMLGEDYPGLYSTSDTAALQALLEKAETDSAFLDDLTRRCKALAPRYTFENETACWQAALGKIT